MPSQEARNHTTFISDNTNTLLVFYDTGQLNFILLYLFSLTVKFYCFQIYQKILVDYILLINLISTCTYCSYALIG